MVFKVCLTVFLVMGLTEGIILDLMSKHRIHPSRTLTVLIQMMSIIMMASALVGAVALIWGW